MDLAPRRRTVLAGAAALVTGRLLGPPAANAAAASTAERTPPAQGVPFGSPERYIGELVYFAGDFVPRGYVACDGSLHAAADYPDLFTVLGHQYGGHGDHFGVPDLRHRVGVGAGTRDHQTHRVGDHAPALVGHDPHHGERGAAALTALLSAVPDGPIIGEVRAFAGGWPDAEWVPCDGRELPIGRYLALHALIGDRFGSAQHGLFRVPDLRRRAVLGAGSGVSLAENRDTMRAGGVRDRRLHLTYAVCHLGLGVSA